jgi:hypothetical protein
LYYIFERKPKEAQFQTLSNQVFNYKHKAHGNAQLTMIRRGSLRKLPSPIHCAIVETSLVMLFGFTNLQLCTFLLNATRFIQLNFLNLSQETCMWIFSTYRGACTVEKKGPEHYHTWIDGYYFFLTAQWPWAWTSKNFLALKMDIASLFKNHKPPV